MQKMKWLSCDWFSSQYKWLSRDLLPSAWNTCLSIQSLVPWITNRCHFLVAHSPFYRFSRVITWCTLYHKWSVHNLHSLSFIARVTDSHFLASLYIFIFRGQNMFRSVFKHAAACLGPHYDHDLHMLFFLEPHMTKPGCEADHPPPFSAEDMKE